MNINGIEILLGSDPELFVKKDGKHVSGHELIPGTKEEPFPVKQGAVQVDGTALEFNTLPAANIQQFHRHSNAVLNALANMIPGDFELVADSVADYTEEYLGTLPKKAVELGCSPDYNAYTGRENPIPDVQKPFRTGSGHIHIGWTNVENPLDDKHMLECRALTVVLDYYLGVPSLFLETDPRRRELYGKAGAFRPKTYGLEYRVLSNFWVLDPKLRGWVYRNTMLAIEKAMDKYNPMWAPHSAQQTIDHNRQNIARSIIQSMKIPMPRGVQLPPKKKPVDPFEGLFT